MTKATINVRGNLSLSDHENGRRRVEESELGDLGGLEKCFGFSDYKKHFNSGSLSPGTEITTYYGFINPDKSIAFNRENYFVVDIQTLDDDSSRLDYNPRKELRGINWWYQKN